MQMGRVLRIQSFGIFEFFKKNSFLLTVTFIFTIGIFIGVFTIDNFDYLKSYSNNYITEYLVLRQNSKFGAVFVNSLFNSWALLFLFFVMGASLFGVVTVPSGILVKGIMQGGITSFLYLSYGLKGIAFNAVILIPSTLVFFVVMFVAARESIRFSLKLSSLTLNKAIPLDLSQRFKDYSIKYLILAACTVICSLIDAAISTGLIKHFNL